MQSTLQNTLPTFAPHLLTTHSSTSYTWMTYNYKGRFYVIYYITHSEAVQLQTQIQKCPISVRQSIVETSSTLRLTQTALAMACRDWRKRY